MKNIHLEIIYTENLKERIFYVNIEEYDPPPPMHPRLEVEWKEWSEILHGRVCREIESRVLSKRRRENIFFLIARGRRVTV